MPSSPLHAPLLRWYGKHARDLPWRRPDASPWAVLVSEVMLQQTPVSRVLPAYHAWLARWPVPGALAADPPAEAIRQWGRLGYPRRALRLHAAAKAITTTHRGVVPDTYDELRALPGVGDYTAAAVAVFAYRQRHPVLDTNVRRVLARVVDGIAYPRSTGAPHASERRTAERLLPDDRERAARWSVAVMELGALVCTARSPDCDACPLRRACAWRQAARAGQRGTTGAEVRRNRPAVPGAAAAGTPRGRGARGSGRPRGRVAPPPRATGACARFAGGRRPGRAARRRAVPASGLRCRSA